MNTPKLARFALCSLVLASLAGCSSVKKSSTPAAASTPAPAPAAAPAAPAAAPAAAKPATASADSGKYNVLSRISWLVSGWPASGAPDYDPAKVVAKPAVLKDVTIRSTPAGATVTIDGHDVGVTPLVANQLDEAKSYDVSLTLSGYAPAHATIRAEARAVSGPGGKSGMSSYLPAALPGEISLKLKAIKDPFKELAAASAELDNQLQKGKITAAQYKEKNAELARVYGQAK